MAERPGWWELATSSMVVRTAGKMALIVGSLLAVINHGDALLRMEVSADRLLKIAITYCVPYLVSTLSSVNAIRAIEGDRR